MTSVRMALDSILEKKIRSFLTMLGIIIGVTAVLVLVALVEGYNADMTAYYEKLGVNKVEVTLTYYDESRIHDYTEDLKEFAETELAGIATGVTPVLEMPAATIQYGTNATDASTDYVFANEMYSDISNYTLSSGRDISVFDVQNNNRVCVLGSYVSTMLFGYADPVGENVLINGNSYTVIGTYYQKDGSSEGSLDDLVLVPYSLASEIIYVKYMTDFWIKIDSSTNMDTAMTATEAWLYENLSETLGEYDVQNGNSDMSETEDEMTSMSVVLGGIAGIALLVGGIGIMNIMLVTVSERTREIGIKKAIGAPSSTIISQFLVEAAILSALGGVIGVLLGFSLAAILGKLMYDVISFPSTLVTVGAFSFSVIIGIGFGLYPAVKAASLQPVDALRVD